MHKRPFLNNIALILLAFIVSRVFVYWAGIRLSGHALDSYWQYLDVQTLTHNLLRGLWYDHAQPPFFNLFLGLILKIFGNKSMLAFAVCLRLISLANVLLLYRIASMLGVGRLLALCVAIAYAISPATILFESELFYTTLISLLLLISVFFLLKMHSSKGWGTALGFFVPVGILCLTRSMYHLVWLVLIISLILIWNRKQLNFRKLTISSLLVFVLVAGWYVKNAVIFHEFSTSSWLGMNMARNVFHDHQISDSSHIEAIEPFSPIASYRPFLQGKHFDEYRGLNDLDLFSPVKNDSQTNLNHIAYIEVSRQYGAASKAYIREHPAQYLMNTVQSVFIFFAPATRYSWSERQAGKIKWFDVLYSFNLSHFAPGKNQRRMALLISAAPKFFLYLLVTILFWRISIRNRRLSEVNLFIWITIVFVFAVSSLFEHYENMRFRFEIEPLFLLLAAQVINWLRLKKKLPAASSASGSGYGAML